MGLAGDGQRPVGVAALGGDHGAPGVHGAAVVEGGRDIRIRLSGEGKHLGGKSQGQLADIRRAAAGEHLDRFAHLVRVADGEAERHVHVGDERGGRDPGILPQLHHHPGQLARVLEVLEERARAELHVEHQRGRALRDLLAHDR